MPFEANTPASPWNEPVSTAAWTIAQRDAAIIAWQKQVADLALIKAEEMASRHDIAKQLFPKPEKGTQRYTLGAGYEVKLVYKLNYKLGDVDAVDQDGAKIKIRDQVDTVLGEIEKLGNEGPFLADRLVKWTPELSVSEYEKLDTSNPTHREIKKLIDSILTVTPGAPELKLESPKAST